MPRERITIAWHAFFLQFEIPVSVRQNLAGVSPIIRVCKIRVVVVDERENRALKSVQACEAHPASHFAAQRSEPDFDLVEPRAVTRSKEKLNSMAWIR